MNNPVQQIKIVARKQFPQSFLINNPFLGALVFFVFLVLFVAVYQPMNVSTARSFNINITIFLYCFFISLVEMAVALVLKNLNGFSKSRIWTVKNEVLSNIIILACIGISTYFAGFLIENPGSRWNLATFLDSFFRSILVGFIPVLLPSVLNIRYAFSEETFQEYLEKGNGIQSAEPVGPIHIKSKAKREELSFMPGNFLYAESEGNYVIFYLLKQGKIVDVIIRNSISEIEQQLSGFPSFMRVHRAFIVNLEKVSSKRGNSLGYQLKLSGVNKIIPVSRQNISKFDETIQQFLLSVHP